MDVATRRLVRERAGQRCEFCRQPDAADEWPFHVDHIIARIHGGDDHPDNLSWTCTQCNLHKGTNLASIDPETGDRVNLFNPRFPCSACNKRGGFCALLRTLVARLDQGSEHDRHSRGRS